ncbi:hypothetical protein SISNIDRAFT_253244 [Sistotremastrum niveocremeum HHB9708]|uniref:Uncharacterized protein n=1 Tax=Sistotremastrum niveocremeum HHB9708 TaxID=1314777 RepID=A0A164PI72_9AGAM|nr:hypothetical protein SISNIDRAFT_253244 [Sistotremastrum niveocremeum HHB9708]
MIVGAEDRGYHFAEWICSAAIIYLICSSPMSHTMSMKWLCLCISGFFAFLLLAFQPFSFSHSHRSKPTGLEASPVFMNMMWTIFPTVLLTTCYRIDFHLWRSGATSNDTLASPALEVVPSQDTIRGPIGQGIIIPPRSQMPPFPRGYFQTSLFAWLTSSFIAIKISSESNSSPPFPEFSAHSSFIALLTMFTGIGIRAWLLGELSEVLSYREEWKVPTLQAEVSLEDGDSSITKTTEMKSPEA